MARIVRIVPQSGRARSPSGHRRRWRSRRRGVSEVVATILLLALTVTLFSAIFAFVTSFPPPPAQNSNEFQAHLVMGVGASGSYVSGVSITHLAGPVVPTNAQIYLKSANSPNVCPYGVAIPVSQPVGQGGINGSYWTLGETWQLNFTSYCAPFVADHANDSITVYIVSQANLIFSVILPGQQIPTPPVITAAWVNPSPLSTKQPFWLNASILGVNSTTPVYANLAAIPGLPTSPQLMTPVAPSGSGIWSYPSPTGANKTGNYVAFVSVAGADGSVVTAPVTVSVTTTVGGISVNVSAVPRTSGPPPINVSFAVTESGGVGPNFTWAWSFGDGSHSSLQSPSHIYSTAGTFLASVTVTDSRGNVGSGAVQINVNLGSLVSVTDSINRLSFSHSSCSKTSNNNPCPTLYVNVTNLWSSAVNVSGVQWTNDTTASYSNSFTVSGLPTGVTSINPLGPGTPTRWMPDSAGTYTLTVVLTVTFGGRYVETLVAHFQGLVTVS